MPHPAAKAVPIAEVASALGLTVQGRRARCFNGAGHSSGSDRSPSLALLPDANRFKCYACGVEGDAIDLVKAVLNLSFPSAVEYLQKLAGSSRSAGEVGPPGAAAVARTPDESAREVFARLYELSYAIHPCSTGGRYLGRRGIDVSLASSFNVKELEDSREIWRRLRDEYDDARLGSAGLLSREGRFLLARHALLFFYFQDGWPCYLQARDVSGRAKCKELSVAGLRSPVPYNVDVLRQPHDRVLVCEGCIDTLSATQLGYPAVGVPGVTGFRDDWFAYFRRVRRVTIVFDNDEAGRRQAVELRARFRVHRIPADVEFPSRGKDLNDLLLAISQESVR